MSCSLQRTLAKVGSGAPSSENAISYLTVDREFHPSYASGAWDDYRESLTFARMDRHLVIPTPDEIPLSVVHTTAAPSLKTPAAPTPLAGEEEYFRARLAGNRTVRVLFQGPPPTRAEIKKLRALLELSEDQYPE